MSAAKTASWSYAEEFVDEGPVVEAARMRAAELGCSPVSPATGAVLGLLAAAVSARAVVEVGTGAGVSGLSLLRGMPDDGIITTIDIEPMNLRAAKTAFREAEVSHTRTRLITGRALDVLPRLTDGAYDLVLVDGEPAEYRACVEEAVRLLRSGGVLVLANMLWHDKVADPASRDEVTTMLRELGKELRDRDDLVPALLPTGEGLLAAIKR